MGRSTMGKVSIRGQGIDSDVIAVGGATREVVIGGGAGTLEIETTMGSVRVDTDA
jgi:hypothetical protein